MGQAIDFVRLRRGGEAKPLGGSCPADGVDPGQDGAANDRLAEVGGWLRRQLPRGLLLTRGLFCEESPEVLRGRIFNIQRFSLEDGPGIRTTVFMKGCPLRCAWCHNPEGLEMGKELRLINERCILCGECGRVCPVGVEAGQRQVGAVPVGQQDCTLCGACVEACSTRAREMVGRELEVDELVKELASDRLFFEESGGGVSFSGGEPFQQPEFLLAALEACRHRGLHTVVDTSGLAETARLLAAVRWTDLFLYDLKLIDSQRHTVFTGVPNDLILDNLRALARAKAQVWIRVPLIPGINDDDPHLERMAQFLIDLPDPPPVRLLPYHETALHKFRALGHTYRLNHVVPPSTERMQQAAGVFQRYGLEARIGG